MLLLAALVGNPEEPQPSATAPAVQQNTPSPQPSSTPPSAPQSDDVVQATTKNRIPFTTAVLISKEAEAKINIRSEPSTQSEASHYGQAGDVVTLMHESEGQDGYKWYEVRLDESGVIGWVRSDLVTTELMDAPAEIEDSNLSEPATAPTPAAAPAADPTTPVRSAYTGTCDCPYDLTSNGQRCGGRSAYSRPGGAAPVCYVGDY